MSATLSRSIRVRDRFPPVLLLEQNLTDCDGLLVLTGRDFDRGPDARSLFATIAREPPDCGLLRLMWIRD